MKRTIIAAATLLLGTSALAAGSGAQDKFDKGLSSDSKLTFAALSPKDSLGSVKLAQATKSDVAYSGMGGPLDEIDSATVSKTASGSDTFVETDPIVLAKYEQAAALKGKSSAGMGGPIEDFSSVSDKTVIGDASDPVILAKHEQGAALKTGQAYTGTGGPSEELSSISDKTVVGNPTDPVILAKNEQGAAMKLGQANTGMGGPIEGSDTIDLSPRPAASNYPPCDPGPGDDRCIQLYEPGVRARLASWNRSSGGLGNSAMSAVGGPYEPLDDSSDELAMNNDVASDSAVDATYAEDEDVARHSEYSGIGGPIEAQSGYPACSPGAGDDSCIQLYEAGVTGAGN